MHVVGRDIAPKWTRSWWHEVACVMESSKILLSEIWPLDKWWFANVTRQNHSKVVLTTSQKTLNQFVYLGMEGSCQLAMCTCTVMHDRSFTVTQEYPHSLQMTTEKLKVAEARGVRCDVSTN